MATDGDGKWQRGTDSTHSVTAVRLAPRHFRVLTNIEPPGQQQRKTKKKKRNNVRRGLIDSF